MVTLVIAHPTDTAVSIADARTAARVNGTDHDTELQIAIATITADAEHYMQRPILNRTYLLTFRSFPEKIVFPAWPAVEVLDITYFDTDGVEQAIPLSNCEIDLLGRPGTIEPAEGYAWPTTRNRPNSVSIKVVCGFGADSASTPAAIKGYILAKIKEAFAPAGTEPVDLTSLLDDEKVY